MRAELRFLRNRKGWDDRSEEDVKEETDIKVGLSEIPQ